jgi:hypothetical protein
MPDPYKNKWFVGRQVNGIGGDLFRAGGLRLMKKVFDEVMRKGDRYLAADLDREWDGVPNGLKGGLGDESDMGWVGEKTRFREIT